MNNKTLYLTAFVLSLTSLTGCQKKVIYATPQITGQVIELINKEKFNIDQ